MNKEYSKMVEEENMGHGLKNFLLKDGIIHQTTVFYSHQSNDVDEHDSAIIFTSWIICLIID